MCSVSDIPVVGKILDAISEATVLALKREFSYLFCYKSYVSDLQDKIKELGDQVDDVSEKIVRDNNDAKTIKPRVEKWQKDAVAIKSDVEEFMKEYQARTSWRCFQVLRFPNPYSRFRLGREAAKKTVKVTGLIEPGKEYVGGEISTLPQFGDATDSISTTDYLRCGSRQDAHNQIWDALKKEDGSTVVGIYGMPGVGKTTMMELVSYKAKKEGIFEWIARVDVGQGVDVEKLQGKLASNLNLRFPPEADNENKRADLLAKRLTKGEKFLVILDDVWEEIPLKKIGIPFGDDGSGIKGCKILLTSRRRDVCTSNKCVDPVQIKALTKEEAWDLFKENVGTSTIDALRDNSLAHKVCGECAGLPLIVVAVGKALREKPEDSWNDALDQFKNSNIQYIPGIDSGVYVRLIFSFKQLDKDAKPCLLLCSLFDEDAEIQIEQLIALVKGSRLLEGLDTIERTRTRVRSKVNNLISSSLVIEVNADTIKLHDIIRDVAKFEAATDPEYAFLSKSSNSGWLDDGDYISRKLIDLQFKSDDDVVIPDDLACEGLHTLLLSFRNDSQRLPDSFFNGLGKVRHLLLGNVSFSPPPSSLQKLADLRILTLYNCRLSDISFINQFEKLEMLILGGIILKDFTLDLRVLKHLQMLALIGCPGTVMNQHALSSLFKLEELHIPDGFRICQEGANQDCPLYLELNKLIGLKSLSIHLKDAISCPDKNICQNLLRFEIAIGEAYEYGEGRSTTKSLKVCDDSLEGGVKILMERAEEVILKRVSGLKNFFNNEEAFVDMTRLEIEKCSGAEHLARIPHDVFLKIK